MEIYELAISSDRIFRYPDLSVIWHLRTDNTEEYKVS